MREGYCKARERHALHIPPDQLVLLPLPQRELQCKALEPGNGMRRGRALDKRETNILTALAIILNLSLILSLSLTTYCHCILYCLYDG